MSVYYEDLQTTMAKHKADSRGANCRKVVLPLTDKWKLIGSGHYGQVYKHGNLAYKVSVDLNDEFHWTKLLGGVQLAKTKRLILLDATLQDLIELPDKKMMIGVMPYRKQSLYTMLRKKKKVDLVFAEEIFSNVTSAIQYMHAHNLVHFDLSPGNVLVDTDGAHVIDLGRTFNVDDFTPGLPVSIAFRTITASVCPPELLPSAHEDQHMTREELDDAKYTYKDPAELQKIDIWSLGVLADLIFHLALTPQLPPRWFDFTSGLRDNTLRYASSAVSFIRANNLQVSSLLLHEEPSRRIAPWHMNHLTSLDLQTTSKRQSCES